MHINPYYPIIRWKDSEKNALMRLNSTQRNYINPIIEIVPQSFSKIPSNRVVERAMKDFASMWRKFAFLDFGLLAANLPSIIIPELCKQANYYRNSIGFVLHLDNPVLLQNKDLLTSYPLALRIKSHDLLDIDIKSSIDHVLSQLGLRPQDIDLLLDFGSVRSISTPIASSLRKLPYLDGWKNVVTILGAFPPDLSELARNSQHEVPRYDWLSWLEFANTNRGRPIHYGDYNVLSDVFKDNEGSFRNFSASIRYTSSDYWVVMRGEGVRNDNGPGYSQYPAQAQLLCERKEFKGEYFSDGDLYIYNMAQQTQDTGGVKNWLQASINHHLAFVCDQLSSTSVG